MISDIRSRSRRRFTTVFFDAVVVHVVSCWLGPQYPVVANILFCEAVPVVTADHRIGQVKVFHHGLQLAFILFGHLAAEDHGDLLGLADSAIQIQESFGEFINGSPTMEDEVVAILHLGEEQAVLTTNLLSFPVGNERSECSQPLLPTPQQVPRSE